MGFTFVLLSILTSILSTSYAQLARQQLAYGSVTIISPNKSATAHVLDIPASDYLTVSIALCGASFQSNSTFLLINDTRQDVQTVLNAGGGDLTSEIPIIAGYGTWRGSAQGGAVLAFRAVNVSMEIGVSDSSDAIHRILDDVLYLGDTTSNQAILFSPALANASIFTPSYPNYTLPPANMFIEAPPSALTASNFTLAIFPVSSSPAGHIPRTGCALKAASSTGSVLNNTLWQRDAQTWRNEWLVGGLTPNTNYTVFGIINGTKVSSPTYFVTKSASFSCPLVHHLPFCPGISYAAPLPTPPFPLVAHDAASLPKTITKPLLEYMDNFTVSLLTFACGRDFYSPLQTCSDCQAAYRRWLCAVQFPRCTEASTKTTPQPAFVAQPSGVPERNFNFPSSPTKFTELLPCLETCQAVDRACPVSLGFKCPVVRYNAAVSYGVGFIDGGSKQGGGATGAAQDVFGNVWCNAG